MSFNVVVDYARDAYLSEFSKKTLQDRYLIDGEISPQDAFARAAKAFANDEAHAQRLYDYASKLWFMFSTPVLSSVDRWHRALLCAGASAFSASP